jgi:dephospho-CoA kinase
MKIIGLTGNLGTGKSTILKEFDKYIFTTTVDCEKLARKIIIDDKFSNTLLTMFGQNVFTNSKIDLHKLGEIIYLNKAKKEELENTLYPIIWHNIEIMIKKNASKNKDLFIIETSLLFEKGWQDKFDKIFVTTCCQEEQLRRLIEERKMTIPQIMVRLQDQMPQEKKINMADYVLNTNCDKKNMSIIAKDIHRKLYDYMMKINKRRII